MVGSGFELQAVLFPLPYAARCSALCPRVPCSKLRGSTYLLPLSP